MCRDSRNCNFQLAYILKSKMVTYMYFTFYNTCPIWQLLPLDSLLKQSYKLHVDTKIKSVAASSPEIAANVDFQIFSGGISKSKMVDIKEEFQVTHIIVRHVSAKLVACIRKCTIGLNISTKPPD